MITTKRKRHALTTTTVCTADNLEMGIEQMILGPSLTRCADKSFDKETIDAS